MRTDPRGASAVARPASCLALGLSLVLGAVGPAPVAAQDVAPGSDARALTGRVLDDATGAPVWGAFVTLAPGDTGVMTDSLGYFRLPVTPAPPYTVRAEQLGYTDAGLEVRVADAGTLLEIRIEPDPVALEGIEVLSERFTERRRAYPGSVRALDFEDLQRAPGQTAFDVVRLSAAVGLRPCEYRSFEEWCVWRRGGLQPVRVYIDERPRPSLGVSWLEHYDASEIYLMEIYDRGAIIRVLTRWAVEQRPRQLAAQRLAPLPPPPVSSIRHTGPATSFQDPR